MTSAHAAGVRLAFEGAPQHVRRWVEAELGSAVVEVVDCVGGMSPGPAARVRAASGRRAFVKACGTALNPKTPDLLRREARVLAALPDHRCLPFLQAVFDDGDWVALLIEDLDGGLPPLPWRRRDLVLVADVLSEVRGMSDAGPVPDVPHARDHAPVFTTRWREVAGHADRLEPWWRQHHEGLTEHAARAEDVIDGEHLLHWDVRADNVILAADRTVLVDWGQARIGAAWMDHALLALDCSMSGSQVSTVDFVRLDAVLRKVDPADLLAVAAAAALSFKARSLAPVVPSCATGAARSWPRGS